MLDTTVIVIKTLSATGKALGRPKGAKDKVKRKPRSSGSTAVVLPVHPDPEFDVKKFESQMESSDEPVFGFIAPDGRMLKITSGAMHSDVILNATSGDLRDRMQDAKNNSLYTYLYQEAFRAGYARVRGVRSMQIEYAHTLTPEQRKALRPFVKGAESVYLERHRINDSPERMQYEAHNYFGDVSPMEFKRKNAQVLKEFE